MWVCKPTDIDGDGVVGVRNFLSLLADGGGYDNGTVRPYDSPRCRPVGSALLSVPWPDSPDR